ncbi:hypothetical protein [Aureispira sp. CCB-QB1]|uniref:hypothetical protein n=1 Tax=Aureispira sp. CCB-QB1 TaxID=1313421 RepID=UPI000696FC05|nr:hypothetical protein [Aureispira sp. CCB-QB1]
MKTITILFLVLISSFSYAQKAKDVLENGIRIKKLENLFLKFDLANQQLKYQVNKSLNDPQNPFSPKPLEDSTIFLVSENGLNLYIRPLNPLNYSVTTQNEIILDPINAAAEKALATILEDLPSLIPMAAGGGAPHPCPSEKVIKNTLLSIKKRLENNKKAKINHVFTLLKAIDFANPTHTERTLNELKDSLNEINNHFSSIEETLTLFSVKDTMLTHGCAPPHDYATAFIFKSILDNLKTIFYEQKKRFDNLNKAYELVKDTYDKAMQVDGDWSPGLEWSLHIASVPIKKGKVSVHTITIQKSGYVLSDKGEIVSTSPQEVLKRTQRFRKFQRFIPEVSIGLAYTSFSFISYGTKFDSVNNQMYVGDSIRNHVGNINISTMLNFNYVIENSPLHPFFQIGLGVNTEVPTLMAGLGIRSNINNVRRIAISGGIALSWVKELNTLRPGDPITGSDDLEKDYQYNFSWPPNFYVGLQYNF